MKRKRAEKKRACTSCKRVKVAKDFYKNISHVFGVRMKACRECYDKGLRSDGRKRRSEEAEEKNFLDWNNTAQYIV